MFVSIIKKRAKFTLALALVAALLFQSVPASNAGNNGDQDGGRAVTTHGDSYDWFTEGILTVMLTDDPNFIVTGDELRLQSKRDDPKLPADSTYTEDIKKFEGQSITQFYAQQYRRTYLAWDDPKARESILFIGHTSRSSNGIRWAYNGGLSSIAYFERHKITQFDEINMGTNGTSEVADARAHAYLAKFRPDSANPVNGTGIFKTELTKYLHDWDAAGGKPAEPPKKKLEALVSGATNAQKATAGRIWAYIGQGVHIFSNPAQGKISGVQQSMGAAARWEKCFTSSGELGWDSTYVTPGGIQVNGPSGLTWVEKDDLAYLQIAGYLDTLLSLAVLANWSPNVDNLTARLYLDAAIAAFNLQGGEIPATKLEDMGIGSALVLTKAEIGNFPHLGHEVMDFFDFWIQARSEQWAGFAVSSDFRSRNALYNDWNLHPDISKSPGYKKWAPGGSSDESVDRVKLRLSLQTGSTKLTTANSEIGSETGNKLPGYTALASIGASLGTGVNGTGLQIAQGVPLSSGDKYTGWVATPTKSLVGGQFTIGFFVNGIVPQSVPFKHSLVADKAPEMVEPGVSETLDQRPKVTYYFGTGWGNQDASAVLQDKKRAINDGAETTKFFEGFNELRASNPSANYTLEMRTVFSSEVIAYETATLGASGDPEHEARKVTAQESTSRTVIPGVPVGSGLVTTANTLDINAAPWTKISADKLKAALGAPSISPIFFTYIDERFASKGWKQVGSSHRNEVGSGVFLFKDGLDYFLYVAYYADTQLRIVDSTGKAALQVYPPDAKVGGTFAKGTVVAGGNGGIYTPGTRSASQTVSALSSENKLPILYAQASDDVYGEAREVKKYWYHLDPAAKAIVKEPMPFAVYSSSPEAFAELKNWGVANRNEPGDTTTLGDGRSPVDTEAGVKYASNGSSLIAEDYEAMAGIPTTEKLYLAVGGSEFIVDIALQYVANETAVRSYHSHFDSVNCQFNFLGASGSGADSVEDAHWQTGNVPAAPSVNGVSANVAKTLSHNGSTITLTLSGSIKNDSSTRSESKTENQKGTGTVSASASLSKKAVVTVTANAEASSPAENKLHDARSAAYANASVSATAEADPNAADVQSFNDAMTAVEKWSNDVVKYINAIPAFTAGSDKVTRSINNSTQTDAFIVNKTPLATTQAASGSLSISTPGKWFTVTDDGTKATPQIVTYSVSMSATNPADATATTSNSAQDVKTDHKDCSYKAAVTTTDKDGKTVVITPEVKCANEIAHADATNAKTTATITANPAAATTWTATVTFTVQGHVLCGPCCGHVLPAIDDAWQQSFNYDYVKIIGLSVLRLDQGSAKDLSVDGSGLKALIGTERLGVKRITYYSSLAYNIAQMNIFDYMGLQTDGLQDVNKATEEYFRSVAVGSGTMGSTKASEAGRVRYWITNSNEGKITAKGPTFDRLVYKGNTAGTAKFSNEIASYATDYGLFNANDYVSYNFGARSNLCDGTARGGRYNVDKRSWTELVNGTYRGKKPYSLAWGKGFIYDGIGSSSGAAATGTAAIGTIGFSVNKSYANASTGNRYSGVWQPDGAKGWNGTGVTTTNIATKVNVYEKPFTYAYKEGTIAAMTYPITRDWNDTLHTAPYSATRQMRPGNGQSGGSVLADAKTGDVSPKRWASDTKLNTKTFQYENTAATYNSGEFLTAYTNTAGSAAPQDTNEYKLMLEKRKEKVQATVISDALMFVTAAGVQSVITFYRNASALAEVDERIPDTRVSFDEMWLGNVFSASSWTKDAVTIASYNGVLNLAAWGNSDAAIAAGRDVQTRLHSRNDDYPRTVIGDPGGDDPGEAPGQIMGVALGAKALHGAPVNNYFNASSATAIVAALGSNPNTAPVTHRTLLYNVTPIVLTAQNRAYEAGTAEVFWETIMQWKDSSNHDYYAEYGEELKYLSAGKFVRLPELLGNSGQVVRDDSKHTQANGEKLLDDYFVGENALPALGAESARAAQAEQYGRGFGLNEYNYDTTGKTTVAGKTNAQMYNESKDLNMSALGKAYNSQSPRQTSAFSMASPYIMPGVFDINFNTKTATKVTNANSIAKSGYIQRAAYTKSEGASGLYQLNQVIVHTPVTAKAVQIMPLADWRDQRVVGQSSVALVRDSYRSGCPRVASLCEFAVLNCTYGKDMTYLQLNLTGSGNRAANTALNAENAGDIIFAGNYAKTSTGLSSGGSTRTGISLAALGTEYTRTCNYKVTAKVTYSGAEQMLFAFEKYGVTVDASGTVRIRVSDSSAYVQMSGTFPSGGTLAVEFGSANAAQSKIWVNGVLRTVTVQGGAEAALAVGPGHFGGMFYLGAWNVSSNPSYSPAMATRVQSVELQRLAGSTSHTADCATTVKRHYGGFNAHVHEASHLGSANSSNYLNGTLTEYNNGIISDAVLRVRLGGTVYDGVMNARQPQTVIDEVVTLVGSTPTVVDFGYTGGVQTFTAPYAGTYTFEVAGAQGGSGNTGVAGGLGGYASGNYTLTAGQQISIYVGGQPTGIVGGWNGGGTGSAGRSSGGNDGVGGGGASDIRVGANKVIVAGGGGGAGGRSQGGSSGGGLSNGVVGGAGGGTSGVSGAAGSTSGVTASGGGGGTQSGGGTPTGGTLNDTSNADGTYYPGGAGGGGGGYYGGAGGTGGGRVGDSWGALGSSGGSGSLGNGGVGGTAASSGYAYYSSGGGGGGGGSGYTGGVTTGAMQTGVREGNGYARISYTPPANKTFTITVGSKSELVATTVRTAGDPELVLYRGTDLTAGNQLALNDDYSGLDSRIALDVAPGTYTLLARSHTGAAAAYRLLVTLKSKDLAYSDIMALPNNAWNTIPYYLEDGVTRNPVWMCDGELNAHVCTDLCVDEVTYDKCTEPHHTGGHYDGDEMCYDACFDDHKHDTNFVQDKNVNTPAAEFVSIDWDFTLYASTIDNFRGDFAYQLTKPASITGRGYLTEEDTVRFTRGKYVRFAWSVLYDGVLYAPGAWVVLGDRGQYKTGVTTNMTGYGGDKQGGNATALWNGEQQAAYNVQNWSLYNQAIYRDLYKDFYDFYVPLANAELNMAECTYADIAVNDPGAVSVGYNIAGNSIPYSLSGVDTWVAKGVNNKIRTRGATDTGVAKRFYVDVVGRIGGFVIQDTTDVKFSNTFKTPQDATGRSSIEFKTNTANNTDPFSLRGSETADITPSGVRLPKLGAWAGIDVDVGNERQMMLTIAGDGLVDGSLRVDVKDPANGDYVLRDTDLTVTESTNRVYTVTFDLKPSGAAVTIVPRFTSLDEGTGLIVSTMLLQYGGTGYTTGLSKVVDLTKQNFYVTDLTDARGVYLDKTKTLSNGLDTWTHDSRNWVKLSEYTQVRDSRSISQRNTPAYGTRAVNTYGTRTWVSVNDPEYKLLKRLVGPLTSDYNTIPQYQTPNDQLAVGSNILYDITTLGSYSYTGATMDIIPSYYAVETNSDGTLKRGSTGALVLTPVDAYQLSGTGVYTEVNIFGAPYGGYTPEELDNFNRYQLAVDWNNESVGLSNRRNVTAVEWDAVLRNQDLSAPLIYDPNTKKADDEPDAAGAVIGKGAPLRGKPEGLMAIGGSQLVSQSYLTQTYIGSDSTYGVKKSGQLFTELSASSLADDPEYLKWQTAAQRWHTTLGLPSDTVFVPLKQSGNNYTHTTKDRINAEKLDAEKTLVVCYIDVYAYGSVWNLRYGSNGIQRSMTIDGRTYNFPLDGPPGAGAVNGATGLELCNTGIPIAVFGGSKLSQGAEIIKVN